MSSFKEKRPKNLWFVAHRDKFVWTFKCHTTAKQICISLCSKNSWNLWETEKTPTLWRSLRIQTQVVLELFLLIALDDFATHSTAMEELFNCVVYKLNWNSRFPYQSYGWEKETLEKNAVRSWQPLFIFLPSRSEDNSLNYSWTGDSQSKIKQKVMKKTKKV